MSNKLIHNNTKNQNDTRKGVIAMTIIFKKYSCMITVQFTRLIEN